MKSIPFCNKVQTKWFQTIIALCVNRILNPETAKTITICPSLKLQFRVYNIPLACPGIRRGGGGR